MSTQIKHRPYLTDVELLEIINALNESPSPRRLKLITYLETFRIKIERGILQPSYIPKPKQTIEDKLGMGEEFNTPISSASRDTDAFKAQCYSKFRDPSLQCSPKELRIALEYAYLNNLLTPTEEEEYERANLGTGI